MLCFKDYNQDEILDTIIKLCSSKDIVNIGICAGRSPISIFKSLSNLKVDWSNIHFHLLDERYVDISSPDSNYYQLKEYFSFLPKSNFHSFYFNNEIQLEEIEKHLNNIEQIDLAIIGIGEDGHFFGIFDNYSDCSSFKYLSINENSPKPPSKRLTVSKLFVREKISKFLVLATSEDKRNILQSSDILPVDTLKFSNGDCYL